MYGSTFNAGALLEGSLYTNHGGKRDDARVLEVSGKCGVFVDEVVPLYGFSVWFYHGNPIAMFDHETREYTIGNCGYETATTKCRLNTLPGVRISQKSHKWCQNGKAFVDRSDEIIERIKDSLGVSLRIQTDAWRGWDRPCFAVIGSSDTGNWSDSPAPSSSVYDEMKKMKASLLRLGIRTYEAHSVTSNLFCMKRWLIVKGCDFAKGVEAVESLSDEIKACRYVYKAW